MKFIQTILTQFKLITDTNHFIQGPTYNGELLLPAQPLKPTLSDNISLPINLHTLINNHLNNRTNFSS